MTAQSQNKDNHRRTQTERSEAMRQRLINATVTCLANEGYAGTTVSKIISPADVSRGAPMHHIPTKARRLEATAEFLIRWMQSPPCTRNARRGRLRKSRRRYDHGQLARATRWP